MPDLLSFSSLPNLHPAVVHFPLALIPAALLFDVLAILLRRRLWLEHAATALWVLGGLGGLAAYLAGLNAEEHVEAAIGPRAEAAMYDHRDWALRALIVLGIAIALRLVTAWRTRRYERVTVGFLRISALVAGGLALVLLAFTADLGGGLVYQRGVAVQRPAAAAAQD